MDDTRVRMGVNVQGLPVDLHNAYSWTCILITCSNCNAEFLYICRILWHLKIHRLKELVDVSRKPLMNLLGVPFSGKYTLGY